MWDNPSDDGKLEELAHKIDEDQDLSVMTIENISRLKDKKIFFSLVSTRFSRFNVDKNQNSLHTF